MFPLRYLYNLLLPRRCVVCGQRLDATFEAPICEACFSHLPRTHINGKPGNSIERFFWDRIPIVRATSFMYYEPHSEISHIFLAFKYFNRSDIALYMGEVMARELLPTGFFKDIDCLLPVPIHPNRLSRRGYNQSEELCKGISKVTGIPIKPKLVKRIIDNKTQTRIHGENRYINVRGIFASDQLEEATNRHILLVDDVLTRGGTISECARAISEHTNVSFSILTLGLAHPIRHIVYPHDLWREDIEQKYFSGPKRDIGLPF